MPRIAAKKKEARAPDKLDLILNALLTRPETCMVGEGCGCAAFGGEALVESLALFLAHGDGSKRLFAARGGLHIVSLLLSKALNNPPKVKDELDDAYEDPVFLDDDEEEGEGEKVAAGSQALGGLVLLQSFTSTVTGQDFVISQYPDLIPKVRELAASEDEALRSGSLQVLGGWLNSKYEGIQGPIARVLSSSHDLISIALDSIDHASMAIRRNAAQLLSVIEPNKDLEARLSQLAETVRQSLTAEASNQAPIYPQVFFSLPPNDSSESSSKRRLVLGYIEVVRALALSDPSPHHPLIKPWCINTMLDVFKCAWNVGSQGMSSSQIYWLHDHQIKENALDALIDLLRSNAWIEVAKDQSLVSLYTLVMVLLGKSESVGHTRASIALLGAINLPSGPQPSSLLTQLSILLELIVDIFNAAWQSEDHSEESREGAETDPPPPSLSLEGGGIIYSAVSQVSLLSLPPVNEAKDHFEFSSKKPVMQVDSGLGYRILLQVIQAWKQIFSRCGASPALLDQLEKTRWRECVKLAAKHSRHQVSSAAIDLLILLDQQQPGEGGKAVDEDLKAAFAEAEEGPEITDLKPLTSDEELDKDEETDSEMLEFLRSFLNASLSINEDEKDQQHPDGLFLGWTDISAAAEKEAKQVREAMDHLPDPLDKSRLCMKYDMLFGN